MCSIYLDAGAKKARGYAHKHTSDLVKPCQLCQLLASAKGSSKQAAGQHAMEYAHIARGATQVSPSRRTPTTIAHASTEALLLYTHANFEHIASPVHPFGSTHATAHESQRQGPTRAAGSAAAVLLHFELLTGKHQHLGRCLPVNNSKCS